MATITSDSSGYNMFANGMTNRAEYIHHTAVDGNAKYGAAVHSFFRRNLVGVYWSESTACGSRSGQAYISTARTREWISKRWQRLLVLIIMGIG